MQGREENKMKNSVDTYNENLTRKIRKELETKKTVFLSYEDYAGSMKDIERSLKAAGLKYTTPGMGNYYLTK